MSLTQSVSHSPMPARLLALVACAAIPGCFFGGATDLPNELAEVTGTVTLDGQPLSDALVTFTPTTTGAGSSGVTDETGRFTLMYNVDLPGAVPGTHTVRVSKMNEETATETVPPRYNDFSRSTVEVTAGTANDFPLQLQSK